MAELWSQDICIKASRFAAQHHLGQCVPGTSLPYLIHLSWVSMEVMSAWAIAPTFDGNLAVQCALLHDVLEDTDASYLQIEQQFGLPVAQGVLSLTKDCSLPKSQQLSDSLKRIRQQPQEIWVVKLADRITNLQPPPSHWTTDKIRGYRMEAQEILDALGEAHSYLATRLAEKIIFYETFCG